MDTDNMVRGYWGPDVDGDWIVTALGTDLSFAVPDEDKARRIASRVVGERELLTEVRADIDYACTAIQRCKEHLGRARLERTLIRIDAALSDKTGGLASEA